MELVGLTLQLELFGGAGQREEGYKVPPNYGLAVSGGQALQASQASSGSGDPQLIPASDKRRQLWGAERQARPASQIGVAAQRPSLTH